MARDQAVVETTYGPVRGSDDGRVRVWRGIRYAAPPVGELRFRGPQPPQPWTEVADATKFGPVCPQPVLPNIPLDLGAPQSEACLSLNIWVSSGTEPGDAKPVMVWVHGSAYVLGSSSQIIGSTTQPLYDGAMLASSGEVVVVTLNYRLGALGFLDLSSFNNPRRRFDSNIGLRDVLFALHWVRDNIAAFGGDPGRVTLFGESGGGGIVTTLLASPAATGLFVAAIAQSSPATSVYGHGRARRVADRILGLLGVAQSDVDRLIDVPIAAIIAATAQVFHEVPAQNPGMLAFVPIVDGEIVPDYPVKLAREGRSHPVPLIIGTNKHEAALFRWMKSPLMPITPSAIKSMFAEIAAEQPEVALPTEQQIGSAYTGLGVKARGMGLASDIGFRMPSVWFAEGHSAVAPVYLYRFDMTTPMLRLLRIGAAHATELPYVWGNVVKESIVFRLGGIKTGRAVSSRMRTRWLNLATQSRPAGPQGEPQWPSYRLTDRACLIIDKQDTIAYDVDANIRSAWGSEVLHFR